MSNLLSLDSITDLQSEQLSLSLKREKRFLPTNLNILPKLEKGNSIFQFYLSPEDLNVSRNVLFYKTRKEPLLTLNEHDLVIVQTLLDLSDLLQARIRMYQYDFHQQAIFTLTMIPPFPENLIDSPLFSTSTDTTSVYKLEFERPMNYKCADRFYYRRDKYKTPYIVAKTRYLIGHATSSTSSLPTPQHPWEIDVFHGPADFHPIENRISNNSGLVTIGLELGQEEIFDTSNQPCWVKEDITGHKNFDSFNLIQKPFANWTKKDRPTT